MTERVLVLHTGGTIGMVDTPEGSAPAPGRLASELDVIIDGAHGELPPIDLVELDPLIDSSNATPDTWCRIARLLAERRDDYRGIVVLHGTDTMSYTASALSFLLPDFGKPVVVTGSQSPSPARVVTDGRT